MRTRTPTPTERRRPAAGRRGHRAAPARAAVPAPRAPEQRVRAAGGPRDEALYACGCGLAFHASVSASVACPHCGGDQAW